MMKKIKVILSTNGPLYLIKSAEFLAPLVDILVIQGWIPRWFDKFLIRIASKIIGRDLAKSLQKRTPKSLNGRNKSVALPEFYYWFRKHFILKESLYIPIQAAKMYGFLSKRYIKNADIFHVRSGSGLGGAITKAKRKGMKVLVDHSIAHPAFMDKQMQKEYDKNGVLFDMGMTTPFWQGVLDDCENADCLLVNSDFVKGTFVEQGYNPNRIQVVSQGVREDFFQLKQNYTADSKIKILFTGSFGFRKGGEYLLKALQELDRRRIDYEMTIVGSYAGAENLIDKFRPEHIRFMGHVLQEDLKMFLSDSDIYLFPSLCEGCASSGMEAMAAGLPVVATIESGLPIKNGENGMLIPSKDSDVIVDVIIKLSQNQVLRERIGTAAANTIAGNYTWEHYAQKVFDVYTHLLNK
ncbi:MAG: glycosyltransferase family 4 protein [Prevotellaceae bacterium]|jgi:glycosyltransferase involved in cell wall biosynthesis|nr:glycosyltransferase family 4 protein [Prevotellaceae bacterium]